MEPREETSCEWKSGLANSSLPCFGNHAKSLREQLSLSIVASADENCVLLDVTAVVESFKIGTNLYEAKNPC